eukprot:TRINITY_DN582_c0_g1_i1.p1 TRINITY_DN582_c0_g1~~TRINITY_DN582_c0_g1_i1.p1  ORF type:complete len:444 (-),score=113.14 TRINITY_DN582_c0_g1_i1:25-1299(-)
MDRAARIANQILPSASAPTSPALVSQVAAAAAHAPKSPDDVVIVSAVRTPMTKGRKGGLKDTYPDDLLGVVLDAVVTRVGLDKKLVEDIQVGNVLQAGAGAGPARQAMFYAGFPETTSVMSVNRQCSSGLQAVANIAAAIKAGIIDIGIGAGVEHMTRGWGAGAMSEVNPRADDFPLAADCLIPMGITSENVAKQFGVSREKQDRFAAESFRKAVAAQKAGLFKEEIVPVKASVTDADGNEKEVIVSEDDGARPTTYEQLAKLKPAFSDTGSTTAGNSSQVSDGAAAVLLMRRSVAQKLGLAPLGRFVSYAVAGVPPSIMGIGPAVAIPQALQKAGLSIADISVFEINEAFASQAVYCVEKLGINPERVNPKGGAIAIGHPLGCTGSRQIATILPELKRQNGKFGVISMCIGSGMGAAAVIERE